MRLSTVELRRFGRYENRTVSFTGDAGMQVLYGPNEAGKTTLLDAITYALHGMPQGASKEPNYGFQHSLPSLRVGVRVARDDGSELAFVRKRGRVGTVLDPASDAAAPDVEARLAGLLSGVSKDVWLSKHSLSRQRLRAGAQALLESGGDAADALFGAATGVTVVRRVRDQVRKQRQALLSDAGSAGELHTAIKAYDEAKKQVRAAKAEAAGYDDDVAQRDAIEAERATTAVELAAAERLVTQLTHVIDAGAMLAERDRLEAERAAIEEPSFAWSEREHDELEHVVGELPAKNELVQAQRARIDAAKATLGELVIDPRLLAARGPVTELLKRVEKVADARTQLPGLEAAVIAAQRELEASAAAAGVERVDGDEGAVRMRSAIPAGAAREALAAGATDGATLEQQRAAAQQALDAARAKLRDSERELERLGVDDVESAEQLSTLIEQAHAVGTEQHRQDLMQAASSLQALEHRAAALPGCSLDLAGVRSLALPPVAELDAFADRFGALDARRVAAQTALDQALQHLPEHRGELAKVEQGDQIADPAELARLREGRDELWQQVRAGVDAADASGDARDRAVAAVPGYEQAVGSADGYSDAIARDGERVGAASRIRMQIAEDEQRERESLAALTQIDVEQCELHDGAWRALWASAGINASGLAAMRELVEQVEAIRRDAQELDSQATRLAAKDEQIAGLVRELQSVLGIEVDDSRARDGVVLDVLEQQARERRTEAQRQAKQHTKLATARDLASGAVEQAEDALARASEQLAAWQVRWASLCREVELADDAAIETVRVRIDAWQQLAAALDAHDAAQDAAGSARRTIDAFAADVATLLADLAGVIDGIDATQPEFAVNQLDQRVGEAVTAAGKHGQAEQRHDELVAELAQLQSALDELERRSTLLDEHADGIDRTQLLAIDAAWGERRTLAERIAAIDATVLEQTRMQVAELVELREQRTDDELVAARAELGEQVTRLASRREELRRDEQQVSERIGSIASSATLADALQDRANALATIERLVPEVRSLALQEQLLVDFLEELASREMGPVVELAGEYFRRLTCGAYEGLVVEPADDGTLKLRARCASGRDPVPVDDGLSEGTRDQLFLALRLATLVTGLESGAESMPLVVDDILLTFDDERSAATLELLAELGRRMQIVFLTHHRRLVELAEQSVAADDWNLVELGAVPAAVGRL
jgi:uncharacterized protein YhaN